MLFRSNIITREKAWEIQNAGVNSVNIKFEDRVVKVLGNGFVDIHKQDLPYYLEDLKIHELVNYSVLQEILKSYDKEEEIKEALRERMDELVPKHIIVSDMMASINYNIGLSYDVGNIDDIDHLGNRRLRAVGELLQNQFRIGLSRMERVVKERMTIQDIEVITPQALINIRPVVAAMKEFFGSSQDRKSVV